MVIFKSTRVQEGKVVGNEMIVDPLTIITGSTSRKKVIYLRLIIYLSYGKLSKNKTLFECLLNLHIIFL